MSIDWFRLDDDGNNFASVYKRIICYTIAT